MDSFVGKIVTEFPQVSIVNVQAQIKMKILKANFQSWHSQPLRKLMQQSSSCDRVPYQMSLTTNNVSRDF